jgi:DNA-directed RNA polymerase specialized sigma24 family protein
MKNISDLDDSALIRQIELSNAAAMEEFYHRFAPRLDTFIRDNVQGSRDIEELLAETIADAVIAIIRSKGQSQVFPWLCEIAQFKLAKP